MEIKFKIKKMSNSSNNNINNQLNIKVEENLVQYRINQNQKLIGPIDQRYLIDHLTCHKNQTCQKEIKSLKTPEKTFRDF